MFVLFWNGPEAEGKEHFKRFFDIGEHAPDLDLVGTKVTLRQDPP
jgi:hypothetical protein